MATPDPWPLELRLTEAGRTLHVRFDDGAAFALSAELLRIESPSAEVQGHAPQERKTLAGKRDIVIRQIEPVGNYAVRLTFADGHDSGLFTWPWLYRLGRDRDQLWHAYLEALRTKGLTRE